MAVITILLGFAAMIVSLSVHEFSHALAAYLQGDHTAERAGRLSLNPASHVDPVGTVLIPLIGAFSGLPVFGWAKPVPYNRYNLRDQKWGPTWVALSGPGSNLVMALLSAVLLRLAISFLQVTPDNLLALFLQFLVIVNVALCIFNLIPIPPLDGANIWSPFLEKPQHRELYLFLHTKGYYILFGLIILDFAGNLHILSSVFIAVTRGILLAVGVPA